MKFQWRRMQEERLGIAEWGGNFDRPKDIVQRAEQRINTVYVKNLILKNQNW
ncbi:hypothetical protein QUA43_25540 [Microcoleus sp. N9_B4]|uniref:hypothetical protein n=1 Tax=Microcoleus sp. N9_B4 TaxID=3055386 RepID=UPI002FCEFCC2